MTKTIEEIVADIVAAGPTSKTPPEMLDRINNVLAARPDSVRELRMALLGYPALWIEEAMASGTDRETAIRIVAMELEAAAAVYIRRLYQIIGGEFSPARFAIVAYTVAEHSEWITTAQEVQNAADGIKDALTENADTVAEPLS